MSSGEQKLKGALAGNISRRIIGADGEDEIRALLQRAP